MEADVEREVVPVELPRSVLVHALHSDGCVEMSEQGAQLPAHSDSEVFKAGRSFDQDQHGLRAFGTRVGNGKG